MLTRVGLTRRLQALRALGWAPSQLARLTGLPVAAVVRLCHDDTTPVTEPDARAIIDVYTRTSARLPPRRTPVEARAVDQARTAAAAKAWAPPFAWDDIDHDQHPSGVRPVRDHPEVPTVDEAILLMQLRVAPSEVARRLGVKPESLARRLRRAKEHRWARYVEGEAL